MHASGWSGGSAEQCQCETSAFCRKVLWILIQNLIGYMFVMQLGSFEIPSQENCSHWLLKTSCEIICLS